MNATILSLPGLRPAMLAALCALASLIPAKSDAAEGEATMLRIVCMASTGENKPHILANRGEDGKLHRVETLELRPSFITEWVKVPRGKLSLCTKVDGKLFEKCIFECPADAPRLLLILLPGQDEKKYKAELVDPSGLGFDAGEMLVINSSPMPAKVMLGDNSVDAKPGGISVKKPSLDDKGMFRVLVSYTDDSGGEITCHDSFVSSNENSRKYLFLVTDPQTRMRVSSLSEFGPFE